MQYQLILSEDMKNKIAEEMRRRQDLSDNQYVLSEYVLAEVRELKQRGKIIEAIKLARNHTGMSLGDAKKLVDELN